MSGLIVGLVMRMPVTAEFNKDVKFVGMIYAEHAWPDGSHSHPAVETVAKYIGCSERSVQRHVKVLVDMGLLIPNGKGPKGTNQYRFMLEDLPDGSTKLHLNPPKRGDTVSPRQIVTPENEGGDRDSGDTDSGDTSVTRLNNPLLTTTTATDETQKIDEPPAPEMPAEVPEPEPPQEPGSQPNIFRLYEENIGSLTPLLADKLREAEKTYPEKWVAYAFDEAVKHNKRNWQYIEAILKRVQREGFETNDKLPATKPKAARGAYRETNGSNSRDRNAVEDPTRRAAIEKLNQRRRRGSEDRGQAAGGPAG